MIAFVSLLSGRPTCIRVCVCVCVFSLFWDVTRRILVVTDVSGQLVVPIFKGQGAVREEHTLTHIHERTSHVNIYVRFTANHNKFYLFRQLVLHVSVVWTSLRH